MYNKERKEQYLKERKSNAEISNNTESGFRSAEYYEKAYGKDLCEWTTVEILGYFKYYGSSKIQSLVNLKSAFQIYTNWCIKNNLVPDNQNHYMEISTEDLCRCLDLKKLSRLVVSREKLLESLNMVQNYPDRFIILGIFEGISTKKQTLARITYSQVHGNEIITPEKTYKISDDLLRIILVSKMEDVRIIGGDNPDEPYIESDCIVKPTIRANAQKNLSILIGTRFRRSLREMNFPPEITQRDIAESGRLEFLKEKMNETGLTLGEVMRKFREEHEGLYGKIQNYSAYEATYGSLIK